MKVIIIGGVAGGATAAARIRRLDENAEIVVYERTNFISYANCGLPYYIGGTIEDPEDLTLQTPASFWQRFRVKMHVNHEVMGIDGQKKTVMVKDLISGKEFSDTYDKLLISTGAKAMLPDIEGINSDKVFTLRTVEDTFRIDEYIKKSGAKSAIIVGGGFIGIEMAENLTDAGLKVSIVQRSAQLMPPLDGDMACYLHSMLRSKGVNIYFNQKLEKLIDKGDSISLMTNCGEFRADMVLFAIGVVPDSKLAKTAGLKMGVKDSIWVNDHMETSVKDIYAVGDAVQVENYVTKLPTVIPLAGPANKQGRIAADNICGGDSHYVGSQGTSVIKVFNLTAAATGLNEKMAIAANLDYDKVYLSPLNHAGYYPGGSPMSIKLLFDKNTYDILGAQIVGYSGVDKRIDVIATAIHTHMKADELKELELAYAPPYSSAKDPVNMAGFMVDNIKTGKLRQFFWNDVDSLPRDGRYNLLDTRTTYEFARGSFEGFINIPLDDLRNRLNELDKSKPVYVTCQSGLRSYIACRILSGLGYTCYNLAGGWRLYYSVMTASE